MNLSTTRLGNSKAPSSSFEQLPRPRPRNDDWSAPGRGPTGSDCRSENATEFSRDYKIGLMKLSHYQSSFSWAGYLETGHESYSRYSIDRGGSIARGLFRPQWGGHLLDSPECAPHHLRTLVRGGHAR